MRLATDRTPRPRVPGVRRLGLVAGLAALAVAGLGGCATADAADPGLADATAGETVTIAEGWVKATDEGMTAAFGTLANPGATDATVTGATTAAAGEVQLHETVDDGSGGTVMQEKAGGFTIPAGGTLALQPGGDHLMLMDVTAPIEPGAEVAVTLAFADGSTLELVLPAKEYAGANETYDGGDGHGHQGHDDHGGHGEESGDDHGGGS